MQHPAGLQGQSDQWSMRQGLNASLLIKSNIRGKAQLKSQWPAQSSGKCVAVHPHAWYNPIGPGIAVQACSHPQGIKFSDADHTVHTRLAEACCCAAAPHLR